MDSVSYRGLPFNMLRSAWHKEVVLDETQTTYRHTLWRGDLELTYSPGAASFRAGQGANPPQPVGSSSLQSLLPGNISGAGVMPAVTERNLRNWLEQPRGTLVVSSAGNTVLVSPPTINGQPAPCDCNNGPKIKVHSIVQVAGERMWRIVCSIETAVNEVPSPFLIVSNRWTETADVALPNYLTARVIEGIVHVRADMLRQSGNPIDALRSQFMGTFSVPLGFQREVVRAHATADGNAAHYYIRDVQRLFCTPGNFPAPRVEVMDSNTIQQGGWGRAVLNHVRNVMNHDFGSPLNPAFAPNAARFTLASLNSSIAAELPKRVKIAICRAWGTSQTARNKLADLALSVCQSRIGARAILDVSTAEITISGDTNNMVQCVWTARWDFATAAALGGPAGLAAQAAQFFLPGIIGGPGDNAWNASVLANPDISANTQHSGNVSITQRPQANVQLPNDSNTRGTWLGNLLTQSLESFNAAPAAPT